MRSPGAQTRTGGDVATAPTAPHRNADCPRHRVWGALPVAVVLCGTAVTAGAAYRVPSFLHTAPWEFWTLSVLAVLSDAYPFPLSRSGRWPTAVHPSICFSFAILLLWGPAPAILVQAVAGAAAAARLRMSLTDALLSVGRLVGTLAAAGMVLRVVEPAPFELGMAMDRTDLFAVLLPVLAWSAVNYGLVTAGSLAAGRRGGAGPRPRHELLANAALLLLGPVLVTAPTGWMVLLLLVPMAVAWRMARLFTAQERALRLDPLTGLLSRRGLMAEADRHLAPAGPAPPEPVALLLIDLDRFDYVNDVLGRSVADRLLVEIARRLCAVVGEWAAAGRLGGGELAVLVPLPSGDARARELAMRVVAELSRPAYLDGLPFEVTAAVGVSVGPEPAGDFATLLRHADVAVAQARQDGNAVGFYTPEADDESTDRMVMLADLHRALEHPAHAGEISILYQPQVDLDDGRVTGVEALLRWHHPTRGPVDTERLIAIAEPSGVMSRLSRRMVDEVARQVAAWATDGFAVRAAVNISMRDLHDGRLVEHLTAALSRHRVDPASIQLEITEGAAMTDSRAVQHTLRTLAELGVELSLDDFGTGFSSVHHLRRLPLSEVKIDRSFVRRLSDDPDDEAIVRSVIDLAGALGLRVVAEGVEDRRTCERLAGMGCQVGQGWYFGRPVPAHRLVARMRATASGDVVA
jgi:diguanylate cyclase (GGDEF)-like protein